MSIVLRHSNFRENDLGYNGMIGILACSLKDLTMTTTTTTIIIIIIITAKITMTIIGLLIRITLRYSRETLVKSRLGHVLCLICALDLRI